MENKKFGLIKGVFIPNVTMMFGVILFLRLPIIVAHVGLWSQLAIIALSLTFMLITSFSIASIATNMEVGTGGVYYLITRTLGIELGGAVGIAVYLAQLISISLTITGFAYLFCDIYPAFTPVQVEVVALAALTFLACVSTSLALRAQGLIFVLILLAIGSVLFGSPDSIPAPKDITPFYPGGKLSFLAAFALFYPALTGIEAGMALSGSLKNPARALCWGNITSLIFVAITYAMLSAFVFYKIPIDLLKSDPFVLVSFAFSPQLVILGVFCATLSSALGSLVGAPRIFQSLAEDRVAPVIFSKTIGKYNEPIWSLLLTAVGSLCIILFTTLDQILPILTMICLITYGLLNFIAAIAELMNTPSWRPQFRVHWSIPMIGVFLALFLMIVISPLWTFGAVFLVVGILFMLRRRNLEAGFQDLRESVIFFFSRFALYHLSNPAEYAIVWHPQLLVFPFSPTQSKKLIHLSHQLTRRSGILTFGSIVPEDTWSSAERIAASRQSLENYFMKQNIGCMLEVMPAPSIHDGMLNMVKAFGIGPIQPNTIVVDLDVENPDIEKLIELVNTCRTMQKNLIFFKDSDHLTDKRFTKLSISPKKRIDLWWDGTSSKSFDLTASLAKTLYDCKIWRNTKVFLNVLSPHPSAQDPLEEYIQKFVTKSRLKMTPRVIHESNASDPFLYMEKYTRKADLTFLCLEHFEKEHTDQEYADYLQLVIEQSRNCGVLALVICFDQVEHSELYYYPHGSRVG